MRIQPGKVTHIAYDSSPNGYTVRALAGGETIDEYNAGNAYGDSTAVLAIGDPYAVDTATLLKWAKRSAKEMAAEYGVKTIARDTDLLEEEREMAGRALA